jgi:hypothetical protein
LAFHSGREADHSPPSSTEVKESVELYLHSPIRFMAWCSVRGSTGTGTILDLFSYITSICSNERLFHK